MDDTRRRTAAIARRVALIGLATLLLGAAYAVTAGRLGLPWQPPRAASSPAGARPAPAMRITDRTGAVLLADVRPGGRPPNRRPHPSSSTSRRSWPACAWPPTGR